MMRFIDAARRSAKLNLVPPILERAEKHSIRSKYDAGYYFCKGLYEWRIGMVLLNPFFYTDIFLV